MSGYIGNILVPQATQTRDSFIATAGQTSFPTSGYTPNFLDVYLNGIKLHSSDFTATNGSDVVLATGAAVNDVIEVVAYNAFDVASGTFDDLTVNNNIAVSGTVDGRDIAADGTKLDGIESGATGDQTNAEIRAAVEAATDSNVFTDADHTKLNAIEASATADQTASEIRTLVESATDSNVFTDADHTKLNAIESGATADQTKSDIDALNINADTLDGQHGSYYTGYADTAVANIVDSAPGTLDTLNELAAALGDDPNFATTTATNIAAKLPLAGGTLTGNLSFGDSDKAIFGAGSDLKIYSDGVNAHFINDTGDTRITVNEADKDFRVYSDNGSGGVAEYFRADGSIGQSMMFYYGSKKLNTLTGGIQVTGNITVSGTVDGRDVATDGTKLDGIESGATADQTAAQILTAIKTVDGSGSGLDADTVDGIQASSFLRSDANDTYTGLLSLGNTSSRIQGSDTYPLVQVNSAKAYFGSTSRATTVLASSSNIKHNRAGTEYDIWTSYNDGSGSGLDADTVDGVQASSFLRSDASDTATGALTLKNDNALFIQSATNGVGAKIKFSDEIGSYTQVGSIDYRHSDSYWDAFSGLTSAGDGFHFKGTEATTAFYFEGNASVTGDLTISSTLQHSGDTDTYMQFHNADQWRVVTGGTERLEVNNSQITSAEPIHAPSFHGDGSNLTGVGGSTDYGAVGTYLIGYATNGAGYSIGSTVAGSALGYSKVMSNRTGGSLSLFHYNSSSSSSWVPTVTNGTFVSFNRGGTWRAMSEGGAGKSSSRQLHLWVRIS
jgi:hypothetical protein